MQRYEQLRRDALDGEPASFRLGQALLERRGVAAWSRAWDGTMASSPVATRPAPPPVPMPDGEELVGALACMALAHVAAG